MNQPDERIQPHSKWWAELSPKPEQPGAAMLKAVLEFAPDGYARVTQAYKQWNPVIREFLRNDSGLRLSDRKEVVSVPVRVVDGLPRPFAEVARGVGDEDLWRVILHEQVLTVTSKGLTFLDGYVRAASPLAGDIISETTSDSIRETQVVLDKVMTRARAADLQKKIQAINEDLLGAYFYRRLNPEVQLYWIVIVTVAGMLGVSIEGLSLVVLAHELAHAYTHLGRDVDGNSWETEAFGKAELSVVEGLAQYYTGCLCVRLKERLPAALDAYQKLLGMQGDCYRAHESWRTHNERRRGEAIRAAMIQQRNERFSEEQEFKSRIWAFAGSGP